MRQKWDKAKDVFLCCLVELWALFISKQDQTIIWNKKSLPIAIKTDTTQEATGHKCLEYSEALL